MAEFEKAIECYRKAVELDSDYFDAWHALGMAYLRAGKIQDAIEAGKRSIEINPNDMLAHTSLEENFSVNLVVLGIDGRPGRKNIREILDEWVQFRLATVTRRTTYRLSQVESRIHILEGRQTVLLNIEKVIKTIRESDEPKPELMKRFRLTDIQAEDILEIRLRQLARLEGIKIQNELKELKVERKGLIRCLVIR